MNECVSYMLKIQNINTRAAREYLDAHIINSRIEALTLTNNITTTQPKPSIFYFQEKLGSEVNPESISLNVAFRTVGSEIPTTIIFSPESVIKVVDIFVLFHQYWRGDCLIYRSKIGGNRNTG